MQYSEFTPHTMRSGTDAARFLLRAGPAPLGVSDVVHGVLDPHRTTVAPSPEWHRLARRFGSTISTLVGRAAQAMHVGAPRRA